jgi:hypothetical protein
MSWKPFPLLALSGRIHCWLRCSRFQGRESRRNEGGYGYGAVLDDFDQVPDGPFRVPLGRPLDDVYSGNTSTLGFFPTRRNT